MRAIFTPQALAIAVAMGASAQAHAVSFNIGEIEGKFDSSLSAGVSWACAMPTKAWWGAQRRYRPGLHR
ncbi:hypothetical protein QNM99_30140 [Pseudomonas sp. PCH446]